MAENYLRNEGNDNIFLQNINNCNINIYEFSKIKEVLENANKDVLQKIINEINAFSQEIKDNNEIAFEELKKILEPRISILNSKNVSADSEFKDIHGDITFGDNNYSYKGHTINIHGGISVEELKKLIKDDEFRERYTNFSFEENDIFKKFLYLDREITDDLITAFEGKIRLFYFQTCNSSQPDWLFHRFVIQLIGELQCASNDFQWHDLKFGKTSSMIAIKRKIREKLHLPKEAIINSPSDILAHFNPKSTHLFHFGIDFDLQTDELNKLIDDFFLFWDIKSIEKQNFVVFLTVKIREKSKASFFMKLFGNKKINNPKAMENETIFFRNCLPLIKQTDIDRFSEDYLKNIKPKVTITKEQEINDMWTALVPEIYHSTIKTRIK